MSSLSCLSWIRLQEHRAGYMGHNARSSQQVDIGLPIAEMILDLIQLLHIAMLLKALPHLLLQLSCMHGAG